jgi:HPt (histidine-containing phosphotransfer) domain-containing protein
MTRPGGDEPTDTQPGIDRRVLDGLAHELGPAVVGKVIGTYLAELDHRLAHLHECVGEPARLARAAHALASPSATLGIWAIADPCRALEQSIEDGEATPARTAALIAGIDAAADPTRVSLDRWVEGR